MADDWHCKQIPNGQHPLVVCERETLQAEIERLRAAGDALAATWPEGDLCNCNDADCRAVVAAVAAWEEARRGS